MDDEGNGMDDDDDDTEEENDDDIMGDEVIISELSFGISLKLLTIIIKKVIQTDNGAVKSEDGSFLPAILRFGSWFLI